MASLLKAPVAPRTALCALALSALVACGGAGTVDRAELEEQVQTQLSETVGMEAPAATCPDELKGEKGASTRCSMTFPEGTLGVTVNVTAVDGSDTKLAIVADDEINKAP